MQPAGWLELGPLSFQGENATVSRGQLPGGQHGIRKQGGVAWEAVVVEALAAHQPLVPAFLGEDRGDLYFSELPGRNLAEAFEQEPERRAPLAYALGQTLHTLHQWEPPLARATSAEGWRAAVLERVRRGLETRGEATLAAWLESESARTPPRLAFCHGDSCLPNFLESEGTITGIVDWGDGGWADPRFDLATTLWSLSRNSPDDPELPRYEAAFLQGYGWCAPRTALALFDAFYTHWE